MRHYVFYIGRDSLFKICIFINECVIGMATQVAEGGDSGSSGRVQGETFRGGRWGQGLAQGRIREGIVSITLFYQWFTLSDLSSRKPRVNICLVCVKVTF